MCNLTNQTNLTNQYDQTRKSFDKAFDLFLLAFNTALSRNNKVNHLQVEMLHDKVEAFEDLYRQLNELRLTL